MKEGRIKKGIWLLGPAGESHVRISLKIVKAYALVKQDIKFYDKNSKLIIAMVFANESRAQAADEKICDALENGVEEGKECIYLEYGSKNE